MLREARWPCRTVRDQGDIAGQAEEWLEQVLDEFPDDAAPRTTWATSGPTRQEPPPRLANDPEGRGRRAGRTWPIATASAGCVPLGRVSRGRGRVGKGRRRQEARRHRARPSRRRLSESRTSTTRPSKRGERRIELSARQDEQSKDKATSRRKSSNLGGQAAIPLADPRD